MASVLLRISRVNDGLPRPSGSKALTVVSAYVGKGPARDKTIEVALKEAPADLVCLQDTHPETGDSLAPELAAMFPHREFLGSPERGLTICSRYPMRSAPLPSHGGAWQVDVETGRGRVPLWVRMRWNRARGPALVTSPSRSRYLPPTL